MFFQVKVTASFYVFIVYVFIVYVFIGYIFIVYIFIVYVLLISRPAYASNAKYQIATLSPSAKEYRYRSLTFLWVILSRALV